MAVNENAFVHGSTDASLYGGRPCVDDWAVAVASGAEAGGGGDTTGSGTAPGAAAAGDAEGEGSEGAAAGQLLEIDVAPAGRLPYQEASLAVQSAAEASGGAGEQEGQPIPALDLGTLEAYVGLPGAHVIKPAVGTPTAGGGGALGPALSRSQTGLSELSNPLEPELAAAIGGSRGGAAPLRPSQDSGGAAAARDRDETAAQAAARAAFRRDTAGGLAAAPEGGAVVCLARPEQPVLAAAGCPHHPLPHPPAPADDDDDFFSSDEESAPTEADSR
jgi:hypothetical protein